MAHHRDVGRHPARTAPLFSLIQQATIDWLVSGIEQHMPLGMQRSYHLWALSNENPYHDGYVQLSGITQQTRLIQRLLDGLLTNEQSSSVVPYLAALNGCWTFEVISDNLAIGLFGISRADPRARQRQRVLESFNDEIVRRLGDIHGSRPKYSFADEHGQSLGHISLFDQSLNPRTARMIAAEFVARCGSNIDIAEIEHGAASALVTNIELWVDALRLVEGSPLYPAILHGLMERYTSVQQQIAGEPLDLQQRAELAARTILVMPTLAYVSVALLAADTDEPDPGSLETMRRAFYDAALLVRLLNDVGTPIVHMEDADREALRLRLHDVAQHHSSSPMVFLSGVVSSIPTMRRLRKDITLGEYNISLEDLTPDVTLHAGIDKLIDNFGRIHDLYQRRRADLRTHLDILSTSPTARAIAELTDRFVAFHEQLYSNEYDTKQGEYAV